MSELYKSDNCFVCEAEDSLEEARGTQSHPINCIWRMKLEHKTMLEHLEKNNHFLVWSASKNMPIVYHDTSKELNK